MTQWKSTGQLNAELYHHGILGQKWGKRNGPPYPLSASDHSASENKAGYQKSIRNGKASAGSQQSNSDNTETKERKGLSDKAKRNIKIGIAATTAALAVAGGIYLAKSGKLEGIGKKAADAILSDPNAISTLSSLAFAGVMASVPRIANKVERKKFNKELDTLKDNRTIKDAYSAPKLSKSADPSDSIKVTNPGYPADGRTLNCTFCTTAMTLREKGYDVIAKESTHAWYTDDLFTKAFNVKEQKVKAQTASQLKSELKSLGDGAYGNISVYWNMGGGHSLFFKNEGGKTRIYDGQSGKEWPIDDLRSSTLMKSIRVPATSYQVLTNAQPTEYAFALVDKNE